MAEDPFAINTPTKTEPAVVISELSLEQLTARANADDVEACYELGNRYYSGKNTPKDLKTALVWFKKGAKLGDPASQTTLGVMYANGLGVDIDTKEAISCFEKAAEKGFAKAQYNLGLTYLNGIGVEADANKAVIWLEKAAENNDGQAQYALGCMYVTAQGVTEDYLKAYKWLLMAEYNDIDVKTIKDMVEKSISSYEKQKALDAASEFVAKLKESTASKTPKKGDPIATAGPVSGGTGFFITKDGYILTAYHIVRSSKDIKVQTTLGQVPATLVLYDSTNDFALLKIDGYVNCKTVPLAALDSKPVLGSPVWSFGYKNGTKTSEKPDFINGKITSLTGLSSEPVKPTASGRDFFGNTRESKPTDQPLDSRNIRFFQMECNAGPGNAGGAVIGANGDVIGIFASEFESSEKQVLDNEWPVQPHFVAKMAFILPFFDAIPGLTEKIDAVRKDRKLEEAAIQSKNATVGIICY